ncbi:MAG: Uma2 family endonuclease [Cyanobacteria bacterium P01_A01_bin.17]
MTTTIAAPLSRIRLSPGSSIQVSDLTWHDYSRFLQELGEDRSTRIAYQQGFLEIYMPSQLHEIVNRLLAKIIFTLAETLELDINDLGATTLSREDLEQGVEPDSCFYIQNAHLVQGLSPSVPDNLPPDLVVEVDIASSSDHKMKIYQAMGVSELWVYRKGKIAIYQLQETQYLEVDCSPTFPTVSHRQLTEWIELREKISDVAVVRAVRQFCS